MSVRVAIETLNQEMKFEGIVPQQGLGTELFHFASTLMPVVNVDLLIFNEKHQVLLSWRDDMHCGSGWHIPGGCIRLGEHFLERIQKTAQGELGISVETDGIPIEVFEIFNTENRPGLINPLERSHFVSLVFHCRLPRDYAESQSVINNDSIQWFDTLPSNLVDVQRCYKEKWIELTNKCWRNG